MSHPRFIAIEGGEGAGKSRLLDLLASRLRAAGLDVVATREPGGTELGERIRSLVLARRSLGDDLAELLLFEAARAHLVSTVIRPSLDAGSIVICDRYSASSIAYQGSGRGLGRGLVERANAIATGGLTPGLTLLLDLSVEAGLARRAGAGGENHFDREDIAFHERVRAGYLELARESPEAWHIVDAELSPEHVAEAAYEAVRRIL